MYTVLLIVTTWYDEMQGLYWPGLLRNYQSPQANAAFNNCPSHRVNLHKKVTFNSSHHYV